MKIMVALDGSEFAEAVVEPVANLARRAEAEVYLVRVVELSKVHGNSEGVPDYVEAVREDFASGGNVLRDAPVQARSPRAIETTGQALDRAIQGSMDYLKRVGHSFVPMVPEMVVLTGDDVNHKLADFARDHEVDLIAMSSHGRTGVARLIMGSHAEYMLHQRIAPMFIVKPDHLGN